ncbi:membrane protein insertase YidC [Alkalibacterium kapii]|uniref:Membrane protein insertase YidC n=1 Tax=Alkalibacterium kapii TaxID=426704 RepID=A0A511AT13_9LACT|nr:membrane protein insertase YidC [Alkalibacterium kapii]GEK91339.1 membrane protein insertase YidC [Alkalibacterium kapii]
MKNRTKRWLLSGGMLSIVLFLSGCMRIDQETGRPAGGFSQFLYTYLVLPTQQFIEVLADFTGSYGLAIIVITIIVRILILPLSIKQQRTTLEQQAKMATVKPVTDEIQAEMKETNDPKVKQELQAEMMEIYQENNVNMLGGLAGCLPLLIQLPIFTAMFQAIRLSDTIQSASWLGINLGQRSIILALLTGLVYFAQTKVMQAGMPEDARKQSGAMMYMSPVMILMVSITGPAGLTLYWFVGGFVAIGQSLITNLYYKPKLEKEMEKKHGGKPVAKRKKPKRRTVQATQTNSKQLNQSSNKNNRRNQSPFEQKGGRNSGKQQRKK